MLIDCFGGVWETADSLPIALRITSNNAPKFLEAYATASSVSFEGQRLTVELFERHLFKRISQF